MDKEPSFQPERNTEPVEASQELYTYVFIGEQLARIALTEYYLHYNQ